MPIVNTQQNGAVPYWIVVRPEAAGQFTAQAVGLPDICTTAVTREEALAAVQQLLRDLLVSGQLVAVDVQAENPLPASTGNDPNDPHEQAYLQALARDRQEDLEQTLRELDQECSGSSSTPTT